MQSAALTSIVLIVASACKDAAGPAASQRPIVFMQLVDGWKLYQVGLDGSAPQVLRHARTPAVYPALSGDGQMLAYVNEAATGGVVVLSLADSQDRLPYPDATVDHLAWSPQQDKLVLALPYWGAGPGAGGLRLLTLGDSTTLDIAPDLREPVWAPDGNSLLAVSGDWGTREAGIYALNPDGSNTRLLIPADSQGIRTPSWAPDGSRIAYSRGVYGAHFIYTARPDGSDEQRVTYPDSVGLFTDLRPVWAPDASRIAFSREHVVCAAGSCASRYDIYVVRPDGSALRNLTQGALWGGAFPSW